MGYYEAEANPDYRGLYSCPHCYGVIHDLGPDAPEWKDEEDD